MTNWRRRPPQEELEYLRADDDGLPARDLHTWVAVINLFSGWLFGTGWVLAMVIALAGRSRHAPS